MIKRLLLFCLLLVSVSIIQAQDDAAEDDIPYLRLSSNFSVPELRGWAHQIDGETVLFWRDDLNARLSVQVIDTQDTDAAIVSALANLDDLAISPEDQFHAGRIGRTDGTWDYQLFRHDNSSASAYALLKSQRVYVVIFVEDDARYDAYHMAIRSDDNDPTGDAITTTIQAAASQALAILFGEAVNTEAETIGNPVSDNPQWVEARYPDERATAAYLYEGIVYVTAVEGDQEHVALLSDAFDSVFLGFVITPDNRQYLYLGLAFAAAIMLILLGSMVWRYRNLQADLRLIDHLADDN